MLNIIDLVNIIVFNIGLKSILKHKLRIGLTTGLLYSGPKFRLMSVDHSVPWDLVSEVKRSRRKGQIIRLLHEEPACASELSDKIGIQTGSVSNLFRELKNTEPPLIQCLTPDQPHHRLYGLTETGDLIFEHI